MITNALLLLQIDPRLARLFQLVGARRDCIVITGARTVADEQTDMARGTSHLTNPFDSLHVVEPVKRPFALAVDVAPAPLDWNDRDRFLLFGGYVYAAADSLGIKIRWGGDWNGGEQLCSLNKPGQLQDLDHFELPS